MRERDPEFDAITEKEIFEEAKDRLKIAIDAETENRKRGKGALQFREGKQWDDKTSTSVSQDDVELTINLTDALVKRVVNNMKQQRPRGKAHPVGDGANIEVAEIINGIGRHVEYRSEASVAYDIAGEMAVTCGWGYWRILSEYVTPESFDQDLRILPIRNIFTVYMDPASVMPTACDADWCIISIKMKRTEFKRLYPRAKNAEWADGEGTDRDWEDKEEIRLAEYFRIREKRETLYLLRSRTGDEHTRFESEMPEAANLVAAGLEIVDKRESSRREVQWFRLNGTKVVAREVLPGSWIPVVRCEGNAVDIDGKIYRRGMVESMMDPARMVNYGEVAKIKRLGLTPKAPWVAAEGQLDGHPEWDRANTTAYSVLTYKPVTVMTGQGEVPLPPPQRQPPAQLEAGFAEFTQGMRSNLLAVAGMPNDPGQDQQGQVVSGRAIDRRQHLSDQSHFQYYDNQTLAIAHTWRILLEYIPHYFSTHRMLRVIGEDGQPRMVAVNEPTQEGAGTAEDPGVSKVKNDLSLGRYDVVMDTGPGYDTKRQEGSDALLQLMAVPELAKIVANVGPDLVFRSIDHPYMQELADRMSAMTPDGLKEVMEGLPDRAKAIVQALANENGQLKKALEQAQTEAKYGITKAHIAATVKAHDVEESNKTKRADTQTRAETSRFDTTVKSHTELAKTELQVAGSLLNTHTEAKYHEREAERIIEQGEKVES